MRPSDRVDGARLLARLMDLARFGAREDGGVDRQALTAGEILARAELVRWGRELGLRPYTDAAANRPPKFILFIALGNRGPSWRRQWGSS